MIKLSKQIKLTTLSIICCLSLSTAKADTHEIVFGVVPQQSASSLAKSWIPLLQEVSKRSGVKIRFATTHDIPQFESNLKKKEYDIAYMNPYHYSVFSANPGYKAFAVEKDRKLTGIIVVSKNSKIQNIQELANQKVAFPAPAAFAASILPRAEFDTNNIPIKVNYVNSHDSVYQGVAKGIFVAGGGIQRTLEALDPSISSQLRVLSKTKSYVSHAFAYKPEVPKETIDKVLSAMESLSQDDTGKYLLSNLSFKGISPAKDSDWDEIRKLKINQEIGKK